MVINNDLASAAQGGINAGQQVADPDFEDGVVLAGTSDKEVEANANLHKVEEIAMQIKHKVNVTKTKSMAVHPPRPKSMAVHKFDHPLFYPVEQQSHFSFEVTKTEKQERCSIIPEFKHALCGYLFNFPISDKVFDKIQRALFLS